MSDKPSGYLPEVYRDFRTAFPGVSASYDDLAKACRDAGPLSQREQRLVKLGIAVGLQSDGAVRSHVRRALAEGLSPEEILHAVAIAIPTTGFPATAAAYRWATEVIGHQDEDLNEG